MVMKDAPLHLSS